MGHKKGRNFGRLTRAKAYWLGELHSRHRYTEKDKLMLVKLFPMPLKVGTTPRFRVAFCIYGKTWLYAENSYTKHHIMTRMIPNMATTLEVNVKYLDRGWSLRRPRAVVRAEAEKFLREQAEGMGSR